MALSWSRTRSLPLHLAIFIISTAAFAQNATTTPPATPAPAAAAAPGVGAGQVIGNIVKTALTTAFPGAATILNSILAATPNNGGSKVSKADLTTGANNANTQIKNDSLTKAQTALQPIGQVGSELATINLFLTPAVEANDDLIRIQTEISTNPADWASANVDWSVAKAQLSAISNVSAADINKVQDLFLRNKLTEIQGTNKDLVIRVSAAIAAKDTAKTQQLLSQLSQIVGGMPAVAGYELANLQSDLTGLAAWAKGAGGSPTPPSLEPFVKTLNALPKK
jgi:hypothetical protein